MNQFLLRSCLLLFLGSFAACATDSPRYDKAILEGQWLRIASTDTRSDSMVISVTGDTAVIVSVPDSSNFEVGELKWLNIRAVVEEGDFLCSDLSADGDRWEAAITLFGPDSLPTTCEVVNRSFPGAPGALQEWVRLP